MTHILFNSLTEIQVYPIELQSLQTGTATSAAADITLANHGFITGGRSN